MSDDGANEFPSRKDDLLRICELRPLVDAADYEARRELVEYVESIPAVGDRAWYAAELRKTMTSYEYAFVPPSLRRRTGRR